MDRTSDNVPSNTRNLETAETDDDSLLAKAQVEFTKIAGLTNMVYVLSMCLHSTIIHSLKEDETLELPKNTYLFNSIFYCGSIIGVLLSISMKSYKTSRKRDLVLSLSTSLIGWICMYNAKNYSSLLAARIITGIAMGSHSVAFYCYIYECIYINKMELRNYALQCNIGDFFGSIWIILFFGYVCHWRYIIMIGIGVHIFALMGLCHNAPESPFVLLWSGGEEEDREAEVVFQQLAGNISETRYCYRIVRNIVNNAKSMERHNEPLDIGDLIMTAISFIIYELSRIIIYDCFMIALFWDERLLLFVFLTMFIHYGCDILERSFCLPTFHLKLNVSSFLIGSCSIIFGKIIILQEKGNFLSSMAKLCILFIYLISYATGWLYGHHTLFEKGQPHYTIVKLVAPVMLCKFIAATIFTTVIGQSFSEMGHCSVFYGLVIMVTCFMPPVIFNKR